MADPGHVPGAVVIPNAVQVRMIWTLPNTKTVYNVLHGRVAGGFNATTVVAQAIFAALLADAGWTNWRAQVSTGVSIVGIDLRDLRQANMPTLQSTGGSVAGTGASGAIPPGDAFCVTLRTSQVGPGARGRVYLPGLDFSALAAGGVASANTVTRAPAFVTALQTAMAGQGMTLAIAQPARAEYTNPITGTHHPARAANINLDVTAIVARNNVLDHQRRRAGRS